MAEDPDFGAGDAADEPKVVAEADSTAHFEPLVKLEPVKVVTGEEDEDVAYKERARLFRYDASTNEWKERGIGDVKFLVHRESGLARILLRQEKTLKLCVNHFVNPDMELKSNMGSDRAWTWIAKDYADPDDIKTFSFAIKFKTPEVANEFKTQYDKFRASNRQRTSGGSTETKESEDAWTRFVKARQFKLLSADELKAIWTKYDSAKSNSVDKADVPKLLTDVMNAIVQSASAPHSDAQKAELSKCAPAWVQGVVSRLDKANQSKLSWDEFHGLAEVKSLSS